MPSIAGGQHDRTSFGTKELRIQKAGQRSTVADKWFECHDHRGVEAALPAALVVGDSSGGSFLAPRTPDVAHVSAVQAHAPAHELRGTRGGPSSSCMALNFSSDHGGALATWRCTQSAMATASSCRRRSARVSWYSSSGTPWATRLDSTLATLRGSGGCRVRSAGLHSNEYRPAWEPRPAHAGDGLASVSFMAKGRELRAPGVAGGQRPPGERRPSCRR